MAAAAAVLLAACSVGEVPGPKYVPESTIMLGPEPGIPNLFIGCWKGTVDHFDTAKSLSPSVPDSSLKALSTAYEFCFTKRPDGTGQLELTDVEIGGHQGKVTHFDNRVMSIDSDFYHATMRNHATVESVMYILWIFPIHVTQDIYADEDLKMTSPDVIAVKGAGGNQRNDGCRGHLS